MTSRREILKLWTTAAAVLAAPPAVMALARAAPVDKPLWFYRRFPSYCYSVVRIPFAVTWRIVRHSLYSHKPGTVLVDNVNWTQRADGSIDCFLRVTPDFMRFDGYKVYDETDFPAGFEPIPSP